MPGGVNPSKTVTPDTTPKLQDSSLQQGDVAMLQEGQQLMKQSQKPAVPEASGASTPASAPPASGMAIPDPVSFAKQKVGGGSLEGAGQGPIQQHDNTRWLPLLRRLAVSPTASGLLQRAYVDRLTKEMNTPTGGQVAVLRQREFDERLRDFSG